MGSAFDENGVTSQPTVEVELWIAISACGNQNVGVVLTAVKVGAESVTQNAIDPLNLGNSVLQNAGTMMILEPICHVKFRNWLLAKFEIVIYNQNVRHGVT